MAYACPRCGGKVERKSSSLAGAMGGLVGMLFSAAFAGFVCKGCGKIEKREFPPEVQQKMTRGTVALVVTALVVLVAVVVVLVVIQRA